VLTIFFYCILLPFDFHRNDSDTGYHNLDNEARVDRISFELDVLVKSGFRFKANTDDDD
jgi:hypothetical protein